MILLVLCDRVLNNILVLIVIIEKYDGCEIIFLSQDET